MIERSVNLHSASERSTGDAQLRLALDALKNEGANFGYRFISDSKVRENYKVLISRASEKIKIAVQNGKLSPEAGAKEANALRNEIMGLSRRSTSDVGVAFARRAKLVGRSMPELMERYSLSIFERPYSSLRSERAQGKVFLTIIESSGVSNDGFNRTSKILGVTGKALVVASVGLIIYNVYQADDKAKAIEREATSLALGTALGYAGGAVGTLCGPAAFVCVPAGVFIGGALGAVGAEYWMEWRSSR